MENSRFETLKVSKFNTLSNEELEEVMGGLCISCKKRERAVEIGFEGKVSVEYDKNGVKVTGGGTLTF